jgi:hypothetical protein
MDRLKSSAISNMKKPSSLFELHSRLCAFQYQSMFLPYLKHILYPLHYMLRKRVWNWGEAEEEAWTIAKQLSGLGLRLVIPDRTDDLVLTTDASKVAASACLFRVRDNKLELVAVNSKYYNVTDLNKCSYVLESIAQAYGLKVFASYLLNCEGKIKVFTDARSLIYCKRNSTHSILLNSTLNYLTNFVTLTNMEIYHLPGDVNVLADVMSRAIADNLNCALNREHPISKQWAKVIPPIPDNFSVDRETLFKFLTTPLKPEKEDTFDRRMKKLSEPKSVQQWFDIAQGATSEERFYNAVKLLEQWNSNYEKEKKSGKTSCMSLTLKERKAREAHLALVAEKTKNCSKKIEEILEKIYPDIKNTPIYKKVRNSLVEASKQLIKMNTEGMTTKSVASYSHTVEQIMEDMKNLITVSKLPTKEISETEVKEAVKTMFMSHKIPNYGPESGDIATWEGDPQLKHKPKTESSVLTLRLQENRKFEKNEIQKIDLKVRIKEVGVNNIEVSPTDEIKRKKLILNEGLINTETEEYMRISLQNINEGELFLPAGTPIVKIHVTRISLNLENTISPEEKDSEGNIINDYVIIAGEKNEGNKIEVNWAEHDSDINLRFDL